VPPIGSIAARPEGRFTGCQLSTQLDGDVRVAAKAGAVAPGASAAVTEITSAANSRPIARSPPKSLMSRDSLTVPSRRYPRLRDRQPRASLRLHRGAPHGHDGDQ